MELAAIYASTSTETECPKKIAFIGSGPLPLSSLCMLDILSSRFSPFSSISTATQNPKGPVTILNIDNDHLAISKSSQLCQQLGAKGTGMEFLCTDANGQEYDLGDCDVVFLAALVGESQEEKEALLENVAKKMRSGALLLIRSADRQRILMYPVSFPCSVCECQ
jgi:nicotianamine synthase